MLDKLFEQLAEAVARRRFLCKMAAAAATVVLRPTALMKGGGGNPNECCALCFPYPNTCDYSGCACEWCWCCTIPAYGCFKCSECFSVVCSGGCSKCQETCDHVKCSKVTSLYICAAGTCNAGGC